MLGSKTHNLKSARLVARRRKILIGKLILSVVCVCFLWWLLFYVSHLKSLVIDSIDVVGNNILDTEEIKNIAETSLNGDYFFTVPKASILFYPRSEIKKNISGNYPIIREMSVGIKSLHEISISIVERKTEYLLCENSSEQNENISEDCYSVDDKGFSFANYSEVSTTTSQ